MVHHYPISDQLYLLNFQNKIRKYFFGYRFCCYSFHGFTKGVPHRTMAVRFQEFSNRGQIIKILFVDKLRISVVAKSLALLKTNNRSKCTRSWDSFTWKIHLNLTQKGENITYSTYHFSVTEQARFHLYYRNEPIACSELELSVSRKDFNNLGRI